MTGQGSDFKRMVLGLPHSTKDYGAVAFTAELAELLGLDLIGIFAEDEGLADLAALPCVREFRLLSGGWHALDPAQLERCASQAAAEARRLFGDAAKALRVGTQFDLVKGQIADAIHSKSTPADIIVVVEPNNPAERITHQFRRLMDTALAAPAAALLVPSRIERRKGPVVVVPSSQDDISIQVALKLAKSTRERLLVVASADIDKAALVRLARDSGVSIDKRTVASGELGAPDMTMALGQTKERLLVLSQGANRDLPSQLAFVRGIPVLVTARK